MNIVDQTLKVLYLEDRKQQNVFDETIDSFEISLIRP